MSDRAYPREVQRQLADLPLEILPAALQQLPFARGLEEQLDVVTDAYFKFREGKAAPAASRAIWSDRRRAKKDMRRAGSAADASTLVDMDSTFASLVAEEYQAATLAAGWASAAAPATIGQEPALTVALVALACHRSLRAVQSRMRCACRAELGGQGVLPGVPAAGDVYLARALGVGHG